MKPFETYQYLAGEPMTDRDKTEVGSKFWNKGKWDNFVLPFLPENPKGQTFIDVGCNAGLFLHFAEELGFSHVLGIDSNNEAILRGIDWRDKNGKKYNLVLTDMEYCADDLPVSDYIVLANVHYYFKIDKWLNFLDKIQYKTRNIIIVTTEKRPGNRCWAQADLTSIGDYFRNWEYQKMVGPLDPTGDPRPRKLWGIHFKSPFVTKVKIDNLDSGNHVQDNFYGELDEGKHFTETKYYKIIRKYRLGDRKDWTEEKLERFFEDRVSLYNDIKNHGLRNPIIVDNRNKILDGNHRCQMLKHLGHERVFVRYV